MNLALIAIGAVFVALGLTMAANRSGYVYFVIGPRSVLVLAGAIAVAALALRVLHAPG
jgi:predicted branched-subunit amino acid permease